MQLRGLLGRAAIYTLANMLASAIPFLLLPLLTRVLSPAEYGLVAVFGTVVAAMGAFAGLSVHGAVNVKFFDPTADHPRYAGTALALLGASTALVLLLTLLLSPWLTRWTQLPASWLALAVLVAAAQFVINVRLVLWQARGHAARYGALQFSQSALNLGISLALVLALLPGWTGRAWGIVLSALLCAALAWTSLHRSGEMRLSFDREYARDALAFGLPLMPHAVGSLFIAASDRFIIANLLDMGQVGLYAAAMQVGLVIAVLADATMKALGPWIYARLAEARESDRLRVVRAAYVYFCGILVLASGFALAAPWLLLMLGEDYRGGGEVLAWVALGGAFSGMYLLMVSLVFFARATGALAIASLSTGVFCLGLSWFLVQRHGAVGAAQAYAASQALMFLATWGIAARRQPLPWRRALALGRSPDA